MRACRTGPLFRAVSTLRLDRLAFRASVPRRCWRVCGRPSAPLSPPSPSPTGQLPAHWPTLRQLAHLPSTGEPSVNSRANPSITRRGPLTGKGLCQLASLPSTGRSLHHARHRPPHWRARRPGQKFNRPSRIVNWPTAVAVARRGGGIPGHRPLSHTAPSKRPALPDPLVGGCVVNKSGQGRADAQRLVATRLLERLHDPLGHFSRLQRIHPRAR